MKPKPSQTTNELPSESYRRLENALHKALGRAVVTFSNLDLNISLCLQNVSFPADQISAKARIDNLTTKQKLDDLQSAISSTYKKSHPKLVSDFEKWFQKAAKSRELRNQFVHGRWGISPMLKEICFVPAGLPTTPSEKSVERRYLLPEFQREIELIHELYIEFSELRTTWREVI